MVTAIKGHDSNCFMLTRFGENWFMANVTSWCELSMEIFNAVNLANIVHRERNAIKALVTHDALIKESN